MRLLPTGPFSLRTARHATAVALFFQWFIVVTGATVRLTGSGLGCPNWPTCTTTRAVPELEQHAMIEFLNRMTATPTLVAALVALWTCWRVAGPPRRDLRFASTAVVGGVLVQAGIGALTVLLELPPEIVSTHFVVSIALLAFATFAWFAAGSEHAVRLARGAGARVPLAMAMLVLLATVILAGVFTTASGPHSGGSGTGQVVDRFGIFATAVAVHARAAYAFLGLAVLLTWLRRRSGAPIRALLLLCALVVLQVSLGEWQYRDGLPWGVVLAHVANAALLWIVATRIALAATTGTDASDRRGWDTSPSALAH